MSIQKLQSASGSMRNAAGGAGPTTLRSCRPSSQSQSVAPRDPEKSAAYTSRASSIPSHAAGPQSAPTKAGTTRQPSYSKEVTSSPPTYDEVLQAKRNETPNWAQGQASGLGGRMTAGLVSEKSVNSQKSPEARSNAGNIALPSATNSRRPTRRPPLWRSGSSSSSCGSVLGIGITEMVEDALDLVEEAHTSTQRYRRRQNPDPCAMM